MACAGISEPRPCPTIGRPALLTIKFFLRGHETATERHTVSRGKFKRSKGESLDTLYCFVAFAFVQKSPVQFVRLFVQTFDRTCSISFIYLFQIPRIGERQPEGSDERDECDESFLLFRLTLLSRHARSIHQRRCQSHCSQGVK